jgi:ABC-type uncharacterized transport system substrate-binding protein
MTRRTLIAMSVAAALIGASAAGGAQPAARIYRVGVLCPISCETSDVKTFRTALATLGYKEGANVVFEYRLAVGDLKRLPELAGDLVRQNVDVIYTTFGTAAGLVAKKATTSIPVVVGSAADLVKAGIVSSYNHPEGNVTGITSLAFDLEGKRLQFLKELLPDVSHVAVFSDATNPASVIDIKEHQIAAAQLGVEFRELRVHEPGDVDDAFATLVNERLAALLIDAYIPVLVSRDRIVELAAKHRIAAIYPFRDFVDAGGLLSYGSNLSDNAKRAAAHVAKILGGAKPADLPVERSTKVELVINMRTARALGLTIPPALVARADEVIE